MKLIVGLGNPGKKFENTRHNVGFMLVDLLKKAEGGNLLVKKSDVFMNESGEAIKRFLSKNKIQLSDLYVIHDDLDIPLGRYKIQFAKGPKDHKGLLSINKAMGSEEYWRVRIGVDNRRENISGDVYVLQDFLPEERLVLEKILPELAKTLLSKIK